ncbi:MAG: tRNA 5-methylaminomethyl-2-thiouridine biosynthesis bifunctional protein [Cellvibrionaceae bacterium]|jgi:tRNA 5-methylaminomethyl-2-thiouridine biosynthesis bifunctional protein
MNIQNPSSISGLNSRGQPVSKIFDDIYFSNGSGLDEIRYFLEQNQLASRFSAFSPDEAFTIGGTGLYFLACWLFNG